MASLSFTNFSANFLVIKNVNPALAIFLPVSPRNVIFDILIIFTATGVFYLNFFETFRVHNKICFNVMRITPFITLFIKIFPF